MADELSQSVCPWCGHVEGELESFQIGPWWKQRAFWRGFVGFFNPRMLPPGSRHIFDRRRHG